MKNFLVYSYDFSTKVLFLKLSTMITESRRSVRTLKEEVQKLDDLYQQKVKVRVLPICLGSPKPC